ncbi:hypothetical protein [Streptomyces sp. S1]|uniref:hypothetical protein n=1 Tax=Streptomyces sp. S1 TaxID=718288 RepID=UPI003D732E4A
MTEAEALIERLEANCKLLADGWHEKVDYVVPVKYHDKEKCGLVPHSSTPCECPVKDEKRARQVRRDGLLDQLQSFRQNKDVDRNPKAERGAPRVKTAGKPPGDIAGFLTLDEITCEAYMLLDRAFEEAGRDRTWLSKSLRDICRGLPYQVKQFVFARPDLARDVVKATDKWVRQARSALCMTVSDAMFGSTVCGNCGGGLSVAWDNSSDVRCVGTPLRPPCGETYPMSEWVALYERGTRR